jgi:oxysterol-binding protein-related protein 9/10/11
LVVAPIEEQDELESRRAWQKVAHAIGKGDLDTTQAEKSKIENEQRELRKVEKEEGREWERVFFSRVEKDDVFEALAGKIGETLDAEKTGGVWLWDSDKARDAKPPFKK